MESNTTRARLRTVVHDKTRLLPHKDLIEVEDMRASRGVASALDWEAADEVRAVNTARVGVAV